MAPKLVCVFNSTSKLIDIVTPATAAPGTPGYPVALNDQGVLDPTLLNAGTTATCGLTALTSGQLIGLYNSGGTLYAGPANAVSGAGQLAAMGFVEAAYNPGDPVTIFFSGVFDYADNAAEFSTADLGTQVFLSASVAGGITKTRPSGAGELDQAVGYVVGYTAGSPATVNVLFLAGFNDFTRISGVCQISQGGTGATTAAAALANLGATKAANTVWAGPTSGAAATPGFRALVPYDFNSAVNAQTGTSYAIADTDKFKLVTFSSASAVAVTIAQAGTGGLFASGWYATTTNLGAGTVTITPTISTINGNASLQLTTGQSAFIWSDGANYEAVVVGGTSGSVVLNPSGNQTIVGNHYLIMDNLQVNKNTKLTAVAFAKRTVTTTYTIDPTADYLINADATAAAFTVAMPDPTTCAGQVFVIRKTDANYTKTVTVGPHAAETFDNQTSVLLTNQFNTVELQSDGTDWVILNYKFTAFQNSSPASYPTNVNDWSYGRVLTLEGGALTIEATKSCAYFQTTPEIPSSDLAGLYIDSPTNSPGDTANPPVGATIASATGLFIDNQGNLGPFLGGGINPYGAAAILIGAQTNGSYAIYVVGGACVFPQIYLGSHAPATPTSAGVQGDITWDAEHIWVCTATNTWKAAELTDYTAIAYAGSTTVNLNSGSAFQITLTGDTTMGLSGGRAGQRFTVVVYQDGAGGHNLTWSSNFKGGVTPGTTASKASVFQYIFDGTNAYLTGTPIVDQ